MNQAIDNSDFRIGEWTVQPQRGCVRRGRSETHLKPRAMAVLKRLAAAGGEVVTRNELFDEVWRGAVVSDDALTQCVVELRRAFGDSARDARVIETIPKVGFRLVPEVEALNRSAPARRRRAFFGLLAATGIALTTATAFALALMDRHTLSSAGADRSLAVLPFVDLSPGADQQWFANGLSEELINRLAQLDGLAVTARSSSFHFQGDNRDLRSVRRQLGVNHVLEGSVRKSADSLRIAARLVDLRSGFQLWADTYDRPLGDFFGIQEEIADSVAMALSIKLSVGKLGRIDGGTRNYEAFEAFMKGNVGFREYDAGGLLNAVHHFQRAVALDPQFALGWAILADALRACEYVLGPSPERTRRAHQALDRALALAPRSPHVLKTKAFAELQEGRWLDAAGTLEFVAELDRSIDMELSGVYIDLLAKAGRASEAAIQLERASRLDPLNAGMAMNLGHLYAMQGRVDEALATLRQGIEIGGFQPPLAVEGMVTALAADDPAVLREWLELAATHEQPGAKKVHTTMLDLLDQPAAALDWLRDGFENQAVPDYYVTVWAGHFGDTELALAAMQRSPDLWAFWLPVTAEARRDPRFRQLVRKVGLVNYWQTHGWGDYCRPTRGGAFDCV